MTDTEQKILSPREYVMSQVAAYPTLYYGKSYEECAFKVFDQFFNVIGNGIRDHEEMIQHLAIDPVEEKFAQRYMTGEKIYWCYKETDERGFHGYGEPDILLESELKEKMHLYRLTVCATNKFEKDPPSGMKVPYPNFEEKYSTVYNGGFLDLGQEWRDAAIWFYSKCKEFFDISPRYYHYAYPTNSAREDANRVWDMDQRLQKYSSWEEISKAYETEYLGDTEDFLCRRWEKEKSEIFNFIAKTIEMLKK